MLSYLRGLFFRHCSSCKSVQECWTLVWEGRRIWSLKLSYCILEVARSASLWTTWNHISPIWFYWIIIAIYILNWFKIQNLLQTIDIFYKLDLYVTSIRSLRSVQYFVLLYTAILLYTTFCIIQCFIQTLAVSLNYYLCSCFVLLIFRLYDVWWRMLSLKIAEYITLQPVYSDFVLIMRQGDKVT
jgi:hypothetical protein